MFHLVHGHMMEVHLRILQSVVVFQLILKHNEIIQLYFLKGMMEKFTITMFQVAHGHMTQVPFKIEMNIPKIS
jgi:hypothetical protein